MSHLGVRAALKEGSKVGGTGAERRHLLRPARTDDLFFMAGEIVSTLPTGLLKAFRPAQKNDPQIPQLLAWEERMVPSSPLRESTESGDRFPLFRVFAPSREPLPSRQWPSFLSHAKPLRREEVALWGRVGLLQGWCAQRRGGRRGGVR